MTHPDPISSPSPAFRGAHGDLRAITDRELMEGVGARLRAAREGRGLTLVEAAERAGLSRRTLYRAERGENPTLLTVVRLLRVYGHLQGLDGLLPARPELSPARRLEAGGRDDDDPGSLRQPSEGSSRGPH